MTPSGTASHPQPDVDELGRVLRDFCEEADVAFCALIDESGTVVESASPRGFAPRQLSEIGALAMSALSATTALSARLGEDGADGLCQLGERWHYYLCPLADGAVILSVFDGESLVGIVKAGFDKLKDVIISAYEERRRQWPPRG